MTFSPIAVDAPFSRPWTLAAPIALASVGLHSGRTIQLSVLPAPAGTGLAFRRVDLPGAPVIPALANHATQTYLSTTLVAGEASVQTVEHVLAALWGLGLTDAWIDLDGPEAPGMDGSALPLVEAILEVGVVALPGLRRRHAIQGGVAEGERSVSVVPSDRSVVTIACDYGHPDAGARILTFDLTPAVFAREIAPARTFCLQHEAEAMRAAGLAKGGSFDNAVVFGPDGPSSALRFPDEPARHKALDLIGDLALVGAQWSGHVVAVKAGHGLHVALARQALAPREIPV
ncbi:MAG: lpxC [Cyanobacteria bacterium RYN_339]|nr:lpxC [Cyanobacteria bacterium RYN_339]